MEASEMGSKESPINLIAADDDDQFQPTDHVSEHDAQVLLNDPNLNDSFHGDEQQRELGVPCLPLANSASVSLDVFEYGDILRNSGQTINAPRPYFDPFPPSAWAHPPLPKLDYPHLSNTQQHEEFVSNHRQSFALQPSIDPPSLAIEAFPPPIKIVRLSDFELASESAFSDLMMGEGLVDAGGEMEYMADEGDEDGTAEPCYAQLITTCLLAAPDHTMSLPGIYDWFAQNTIKGKRGRFENSVRHNLSLNAAFENVGSVRGGRNKKDHLWRLTDEAVRNGTQPTTSFRKNISKPNRAGKAAPHRQLSGAKGGRATRASLRRRKEATGSNLLSVALANHAPRHGQLAGVSTPPTSHSNALAPLPWAPPSFPLAFAPTSNPYFHRCDQPQGVSDLPSPPASASQSDDSLTAPACQKVDPNLAWHLAGDDSVANGGASSNSEWSDTAWTDEGLRGLFVGGEFGDPAEDCRE